jgi:hypothetical protein
MMETRKIVATFPDKKAHASSVDRQAAEVLGVTIKILPTRVPALRQWLPILKGEASQRLRGCHG